MTPTGTKIPEILQQFLAKNNVKVRDVSAVEQKILALISEGPNLLQVITDFDQTLTKFHHNGELCDSTYSVLSNSPMFSREFKEECYQSCKKYGPIEVNHDMSIEERIPYMLEWQNEFLQSLIKSRVNQALIQKAIETSKTYLRDKADTVLAKLTEAKVPVLIFSAGIEDILLGILDMNRIPVSNFRIVSNRIKFDKDEFIIGFQSPTIHSFNKNQSHLEKEEKNYFAEISHRHNAILVGDNIGDIHMTDGLNTDNTTILKIGFLEENGSGNLESFMLGYDIVILDDQSWDLVDALVNCILQEK